MDKVVKVAGGEKAGGRASDGSQDIGVEEVVDVHFFVGHAREDGIVAVCREVVQEGLSSAGSQSTHVTRRVGYEGNKSEIVGAVVSTHRIFGAVVVVLAKEDVGDGAAERRWVTAGAGEVAVGKLVIAEVVGRASAQGAAPAGNGIVDPQLEGAIGSSVEQIVRLCMKCEM